MSEILGFCGLNDFEFWLVVRLYIAAFIPIFLTANHLFYKKKPNPTSLTLIFSFFIVTFGWEIWLTYGFGGGLPVDERRSVALSCAIPQNLNWILNSLADVFIIWIALIIVKNVFRNNVSVFNNWNWKVVLILFVWFMAQNIYVEAFFYHLQLGSNGDLSWAPMQPLGSWYNPTLFKIAGNPITFQSQSSWFIMTPVVYLTYKYFYKNHLSDKNES